MSTNTVNPPTISPTPALYKIRDLTATPTMRPTLPLNQEHELITELKTYLEDPNMLVLVGLFLSILFCCCICTLWCCCCKSSSDSKKQVKNLQNVIDQNEKQKKMKDLKVNPPNKKKRKSTVSKKRRKSVSKQRRKSTVSKKRRHSKHHDHDQRRDQRHDHRHPERKQRERKDRDRKERKRKDRDHRNNRNDRSNRNDRNHRNHRNQRGPRSQRPHIPPIPPIPPDPNAADIVPSNSGNSGNSRSNNSAEHREHSVQRDSLEVSSVEDKLPPDLHPSSHQSNDSPTYDRYASKEYVRYDRKQPGLVKAKPSPNWIKDRIKDRKYNRDHSKYNAVHRDDDFVLDPNDSDHIEMQNIWNEHGSDLSEDDYEDFDDGEEEDEIVIICKEDYNQNYNKDYNKDYNHNEYNHKQLPIDRPAILSEVPPHASYPSLPDHHPSLPVTHPSVDPSFPSLPISDSAYALPDTYNSQNVIPELPLSPPTPPRDALPISARRQKTVVFAAKDNVVRYDKSRTCTEDSERAAGGGRLARMPYNRNHQESNSNESWCLSIAEARAIRGPDIEQMLSDRDFRKLFKMNKNTFYGLQGWEQEIHKKRAGLC